LLKVAVSIMNGPSEQSATNAMGGGAAPLLDPFGLVGATLAGKYDVASAVAETELSVVYRATHRIWRRPAAIKVFKSPMLAETARESLLASFVREGALMMDLSERCSAICQARDVGSTLTASGDWVPYMVLEWLDGESLDAALARDRSPRQVREAFDLLDPVANALAVAHERGIVHLDVKPGNVFILRHLDHEPAREGAPRAKLLDFGIAKVVDLAGAARGLEGYPLQRSFTPAYGAPEQFNADYGPTGPFTDVFSLALVFVELVTGREPLDGDTIESLAAHACDLVRRPTPRTLGVAVRSDVERVLARALAVKPADRYPNAGDFWFALGHAVRKRSATPPVAVPSALPPARLLTTALASRPPPAPGPSLAETTMPISLRHVRRSSHSGRPSRAPAIRRTRAHRWLVPAAAIAGAVTGLAALRELAPASSLSRTLASALESEAEALTVRARPALPFGPTRLGRHEAR
jgi:serine/threonine protein kinase